MFCHNVLQYWINQWTLNLVTKFNSLFKGLLITVQKVEEWIEIRKEERKRGSGWTEGRKRESKQREFEHESGKEFLVNMNAEYNTQFFVGINYYLVCPRIAMKRQLTLKFLFSDIPLLKCQAFFIIFVETKRKWKTA